MPYAPSVTEVLKLPEIVARQWWGPERMREWQDRRLRKLVRHAYEKVPFYRARWDAAGVSPQEINSIDDLSKLPVISGAEFRSAAAETTIAAGTDVRKCRVIRTSGSTGRPLSVYYTRSDQFNVLKAMSVRHYIAHGVGVRDRLVSFAPGGMVNRHGWYERFGFWRRLTLDATQEARTWPAPLRDERPDVIAGSAMSLHELVLELQSSGETLPAPRLIFSSGGRLELETRRLIESVMGAPVHDVYGANEAGFLAWECPQCQGYHLNVDTLIVEVLNDGAAARPGRPGNMVITNLFSTAMPFIRYELGDVVTLSDKKPVCGRSLPLMEEVWGRNDDVIYLPSRKSVGIYAIYMIMLQTPFIAEFLLEQDAAGACTLRVVSRDAVGAENLRELQSKLENIFENALPVRVELVNQINRDPKAKWKAIVSHVI